MLRRLVVVAMGIGVGFGLIMAGTAMAQKKGKSRAAATKYLMRGITQAHCKGLGELLKDSGPADEKAWDTAACHASCLNEISYVIMDDGRCPDGVWKGAAENLREGSAGVLAATEKKDLDTAKESFKKVTGACGSCHKAHKK
jgi:cytochrome c556